MDWTNIKDYQFLNDTYINPSRVDEEIESINQDIIKDSNFRFEDGMLSSWITRVYAKSLAKPIEKYKYIYCDSMAQVEHFCILFMMRLSDVYIPIAEPNTENVGDSIKSLMSCYEEYIKITNIKSSIFNSIKNFLYNLPSKKNGKIMIKDEYLDQYYCYYADALRMLLSVLSTIYNHNLQQPNLSPNDLILREKRGYSCNFIAKDEDKFKKLMADFEEEYCFAEQKSRGNSLFPYRYIEIKSLGFNNLCLHITNTTFKDNNEGFSILHRFIDYSDIRTVIFENCYFSCPETILFRQKSFIFKNCTFDCEIGYWEMSLGQYYQHIVTLLKFDNCRFNNKFTIDKIQKGCLSSLILRNCNFSDHATLSLSNIRKLKIIICNTIFGAKVALSDINFHYGEFSNVVFLDEFRTKNIKFTSKINFKQIVFSANVVRAMSNSIRAFVKALENSGFNDYAEELADFYLNRLDNTKKQSEFDIAMQSNWLNIKQTATYLGISYTTLLAMRKEDKATGITRIPYIGEGKSSRYYYPLLIAYKKKDMDLVNKLAKEMDTKQ